MSYAAVELAKQIFDDPGQKESPSDRGRRNKLAARHRRGRREEAPRGEPDDRAGGGPGRRAEGARSRPRSFRPPPPRVGHRHLLHRCPPTIIHAETVQRIMRERRGRPIFFIDIAVPRDIDADVGDLENFCLFNIDDLQAVVDQNLDNRRVEAERAEAIVAQEADALDRSRGLSAVPTITQASRRRRIGRPAEEFSKTFSRLNGIDEKGTAGHRRPHAGDRPEDPSPAIVAIKAEAGVSEGEAFTGRRAAPLQPGRELPAPPSQGGQRGSLPVRPWKKVGQGTRRERVLGRSQSSAPGGGMRKNRLRIGTRGSALAFWQANHVLGLPPGLVAVEIVTITTTGDKILDSSGAGGREGIVRERDRGRRFAGEVDLAVHSAQRTFPAFFPDGWGWPPSSNAKTRRDLSRTRLCFTDELPERGARRTISPGGRAQLLHPPARSRNHDAPGVRHAGSEV